jgi:galactokinase
VIRRPGEALRAAGMSETGAARADQAFDAARAVWQSLDPSAPPRWLFVPGRIEVLGKHTDYAGGTTLTCAIERGFCFVHSPRRDGRLCMADAGRGQRTEFRISPDMEVAGAGWPAFPMTVARRLARNFDVPLAGADIGFISTLPGCAGMSSSSSLITGTYLILADVNALAERPEYQQTITSGTALAGYLGSIENGSPFGVLRGDRGVGTFGGSEDHAAILCSRPGHVGEFEFCPVRHVTHLPLPDGCAFAIAASGIIADKTGNARDDYNRASALVGAILRRWRAATGRADETLRAAVRSSGDALERLGDVLQGGDDTSRALIRRVQHFVVENERLVPAAVVALTRGDRTGFGDIVDQSQRAAEDLLGNQVPETIVLTRSARELGAVAASSFGAGFGGSVWALVPTCDAGQFAAAWRERYQRAAAPDAFARAVFFTTPAGPPATRMKDDA